MNKIIAKARLTGFLFVLPLLAVILLSFRSKTEGRASTIERSTTVSAIPRIYTDTPPPPTPPTPPHIARMKKVREIPASPRPPKEMKWRLVTNNDAMRLREKKMISERKEAGVWKEMKESKRKREFRFKAGTMFRFKKSDRTFPHNHLKFKSPKAAKEPKKPVPLFKPKKRPTLSFLFDPTMSTLKKKGDC